MTRRSEGYFGIFPLPSMTVLPKGVMARSEDLPEMVNDDLLLQSLAVLCEVLATYE
jgi:hypothetical protein